MVLLGHGSMISFLPSDIAARISSGSKFWLLAPSPWAGVWVFFVLSGYLMGKGFFSGRYPFSRDGLLTFYRNRLLRILPLYWFAVLAISLLMKPEIFAPKNIWMLAAILLFDYSGAFAINPIGALWSVSTEVQFYILVPFLFVLYASLIERRGTSLRFPPWLGVVALLAAAWLTASFLSNSSATTTGMTKCTHRCWQTWTSSWLAWRRIGWSSAPQGGCASGDFLWAWF